MPDYSQFAYDPEQQALERKRMLAQALLGQSMQPIELPNYPGAAVSPWQGAAKLMQALMGGLMNRKLDKQQSALNEKLTNARQQIIQSLANAGQVFQPQTVTTPGGSMPVAPPMTNEDQMSTLLQGAGSPDPRVQQIAAALMQNRFQQENEQRQTEAQRQAALFREGLPSVQAETGLHQAQALGALQKPQFNPAAELQGYGVWASQQAQAGKPSDYESFIKMQANAKEPISSERNLSKNTVLYKGHAQDILENLITGKQYLQTPQGLQDITGETSHYEPPRASLQVLQSQLKSVADWVQAINTGQASLEDAPSNIRGDILSEGKKLGVTIVPVKVREAITEVARAKNLLQPIRQGIDAIQAAKQAGNTAALAENSLLLERYTQSIGTMLARSMGEKGVVTDRDVARVTGIVPGWKAANFAPGYAEKEWSWLNGILDNQEKAWKEGYFTPIQRGGATSGVKPGGAVEALINRVRGQQ